jgi:tetratricopeptide (TPR) repeat protein
MAKLYTFISHSYRDHGVCRNLARALRQEGASAWYDDYRESSPQQQAAIKRAITLCPVFILLLSESALSTPTIQEEAQWAYECAQHDARRLIIPVVLEVLQEPTLWPFLAAIPRIEASHLNPYSYDNAIQRTLQALDLQPLETMLVASAASSNSNIAPLAAVDEEALLEEGQELLAQHKFAEALHIFEQATTLVPESAPAWFQQARALERMGLYRKAIAAYDQVSELDPTFAAAWRRKGQILEKQQHYQDALASYERALSLEPHDSQAAAQKAALLARLTPATPSPAKSKLKRGR